MRKAWTEEEEAYLRDHVGKCRIDVIAKHLDRSLNAVILKMKRLGIANTKEQVGHLTFGELAKLLGVDRKSVELWAKNHQLPYVKKKSRHSKTFYFVDPVDFWKWAFHHQDRVNFQNIERNSLPPEPDWVDSLRFSSDTTRSSYRAWSTKEEKRLLDLYEKGESVKEISSTLKRTPTSVARKIKRIRNH